MNHARSILKEVFGFETFWPLQEKIISFQIGELH